VVVVDHRREVRVGIDAGPGKTERAGEAADAGDDDENTIGWAGT
jgi:hypothetical protein